MSVAQRAALAVRLQYWDVSLTGLLPKQARALTKVGVGSVRLAGNADEADLTALKRDQMSLRQLRNENRKAPTPIDIENFIRCVGPTAILNVLDRMTASTRVAAAAEYAAFRRGALMSAAFSFSTDPARAGRVITGALPP